MSPRLKPRLACLLVPVVFGVLAVLGLLAHQAELLEVLLIAAFGAVMLLWVFEWGRDRAGITSATSETASPNTPPTPSPVRKR